MHQTVQEFLLDPHGDISKSTFSMHEIDMNAWMAELCMHCRTVSTSYKFCTSEWLDDNELEGYVRALDSSKFLLTQFLTSAIISPAISETPPAMRK
jgi:hypothetical protein